MSKEETYKDDATRECEMHKKKLRSVNVDASS